MTIHNALEAPKECNAVLSQPVQPHASAPFGVVVGNYEEAAEDVSPNLEVQNISGCLIKEDGIFLDSSDDDPVFICSPLEVLATYATSDSRGWGKLVRLQSSNGEHVTLRIDNAELQSAASKVLARLADSGLEMGPDKKSKDRIIRLLKQWKPARHLLSVSQVGWTSDKHSAFLAGNTAVGSAEILPPAFAGVSEPRGSWTDWRDNVGKLCIGNPMMILAASLAFSGPLLSLCGMHGGGLHFRGSSSSGKTTLLALANSVWADRKSIRQWRATSNGIEVLAQRSNDMLLALDELAEVHERDLSATIYILANGVPKVRMTKDINLQDGPCWRLALISSGEISVAQKLREAGHHAMKGHEVRLIDIEADSCRYGVFDNLHGFKNGAELADRVQLATRETYGSVGRSFVERIITHRPKVENALSTVDQLVSKWKTELSDDADGYVIRVARRFAIIARSGQIATALGLTGWPIKAAEEAAEGAFFDWYDRVHADKQDAASDALQRLQGYVSAHPNLIQTIGTVGNTPTVPAAWKDESRIYFLPETWSQIMAGLDEKAVGKALVEVGVLQPGDGDRLMRKAPRSILVQNKRPRLFTVNACRLTQESSA